ncbi:asparagine synthetase B [Longispora fulva]|uniref:asparagine synthase (glutamine-hydrolyzing) n=1 Tax=Longispora fulva TaxID=619741 RepID=A0A8J7GJG9_9ACTN|nr:asparagine synthase (glutamine-hydrolyzing) [Longispora fulva]MBG6140499.1 asparagine synthase (glutamine-hydrolyzing) [Longispora fulva]GIG57119.1 asparagine synthetase B [Longispora fulva]
MCGITGYTSWAISPKNEPEVIRAMTNALLPRGPDADDVLIGEEIALGHTRLAVLDAAGGAQPMTAVGRAGGLVAVVYSGEVYNHRQLRRQLQQLGHRFTSRSDTEVVLRAWIEWGPAAPERLVGMFAFAVWDEAVRSLFLVRDHLGIKPLLYARTGDGGTVFGSEAKAVLQHPRVEAALDRTGIAELFALAPNTSPGHAVFAGLQDVRPGTIVTVTGRHAKVRQYWRWTPHEHPDDVTTTVDTLRGLLEEAVAAQSGADRPVGALLSGGLDSSSIAALLDVDGLPTWAVDYDGGGNYASSALHVDRDTPYAELVAEHIGSRHTTHYVTVTDLIAGHAATVQAMDLPGYGPINVPLRLLLEHLGPHTPVVLSGEGADELAGGYAWHQLSGAEPDTFPWTRSYRPMDYLLRKDVTEAVQPGAYRRQRYQEALDEVPHLRGERGPARRLREIYHLTDEYYLQFLLRRKDRLAMSVGVEARVPFLHLPLVEYARSIPIEWRRQAGMEKGLLRRAVEGLLPEKVAWRRKSGFPVAASIEFQRYLWGAARDLLAESSSPVWTLLDRDTVAWVVKRAESDRSDWTSSLHICFVIECGMWFSQHPVRLL